MMLSGAGGRGTQAHYDRGAVAVQRDGRSHKLNVRLQAHWGCHDLTALNPPEVLLQPQTAADGLAMA